MRGGIRKTTRKKDMRESTLFWDYITRSHFIHLAFKPFRLVERRVRCTPRCPSHSTGAWASRSAPPEQPPQHASSRPSHADPCIRVVPKRAMTTVCNSGRCTSGLRPRGRGLRTRRGRGRQRRMRRGCMLCGRCAISLFMDAKG